MALWLFLTFALAQTPGSPDEMPDSSPPAGVEVVVPGALEGADVLVGIRRDGNVMLEDKLVMDRALASAFTALAVARPGVRLVIAPDENADYGRVNEVVRAAGLAGIERVAVQVVELAPAPAEPEVVDDSGRIKRRKLPQSPYAHVDFTAYTLERGEARIGLTTIGYGVTDRFQLATAPVPDAIGVWNLIAKANLIRAGRMDYALTGNVYFAPVAEILNKLGAGSYVPGVKKKDEPSFSASLTWAEVGARASFRLTNPWSAHLGMSYARVNAKGELPLGELPTVDIPQIGEIGGNEIRIAPELIGDLLQMRFATDYRLNRRDSAILQFSAPTYFSVRGIFHPPKKGIPKEFQNFYAAVGYSQSIPLGAFYTASVAWQFSWQHVDLRVGVPLGKNPLGYFQAFNLTYRFGGETRRDARLDRKDQRVEAKASAAGG